MDSQPHASGTDRIRQLTAAVSRGNEAAFRQLYDLYHERLFRLALVINHGDEFLARDIVQSVMLTAARKLGKTESEEHLWNWLARVARQHSSKAWRQQKREAVLITEEDQLQEIGASEADSMLEDYLDAAICELDPPDRQVIEWFYFDDRGHKEIADTLGTTPKAVSGRLERLRIKLRSFVMRRLSNET